MKQICAYCGQDTYNVDWDYLVGHNHLSCVLAAEQTAEKMQIVNWKKLSGEKLSVSGADLYFTNCEENIKEYKCEISTLLNKHPVFFLRLKKLPGMFDLEIEHSQLQTGTKVKRLIKVNDIKSIKTFILSIENEIGKNNIFKSMCNLIYELQLESKKKTKLKPVSGNINFNMPVSQSIQW